LKFKLLWSKAQHTLFTTCSPLIILYFENRNWPVEILKWLFLWFFVSILISDFRNIFWWFVMRWPFYEFQKQDANEHTWFWEDEDDGGVVFSASPCPLLPFGLLLFSPSFSLPYAFLLFLHSLSFFNALLSCLPPVFLLTVTSPLSFSSLFRSFFSCVSAPPVTLSVFFSSCSFLFLQVLYLW